MSTQVIEDKRIEKPMNNTNCCVYGCKSIKKKNPNLSFHPFPKKGQKIVIKDEFGESSSVERRKLWEIKLKMGKRATDSMSVCSLHFESSDYLCSGWSSWKRLLASSIPSKNLPQTSSCESQRQKIADDRKEARAKRLSKRRFAPSTNVSNQIEYENGGGNEKEVVNSVLQLEDTEVNSVLPFEESVCCCPCHVTKIKIGTDSSTQTVEITKSYVEQEIQVNTNEMVTITDLINTDSQLNSLTGLMSFQMLNSLIFLLNNLKNDKRIHRLNLFNRVLLFFIKLKLDLPYVVLAVLFRVSSETCKRIFFDIAKVLSPLCRVAIPFPSKEEIMQNMPKCFDKFQNVRIVLDCTEVPIQRHKRLCCRIKTYSHYKGNYTIKFMTGVSPGGLITFVSRAYGGRCSDKAIFEQSGLLDKLLMFQDAIMVDKGFLIEDLCDEFGIKLVRPPFLRKKNQLSHAEAIQNAKIACARVHIERSNQRIKIFRIFRNRLPVTLIPIIEDLFVIVCAIVNLSNSILADDKYL